MIAAQLDTCFITRFWRWSRRLTSVSTMVLAVSPGIQVVDEADDMVVDVLEVGSEFLGDKAVLAPHEAAAHLPHRHDQTV